jgi:hypothetical protein
MLDANRDLSSAQRIGLATLRGKIASARALLDLVEQHLPFATGKDSATDSLAMQVAEELLRVAQELVLCARKIAPDVKVPRGSGTENAA